MEIFSGHKHLKRKAPLSSQSPYYEVHASTPQTKDGSADGSMEQ